VTLGVTVAVGEAVAGGSVGAAVGGTGDAVAVGVGARAARNACHEAGKPQASPTSRASPIQRK